MHSDLIIYVDFDSTLYDTGKFTAELWKLIADEAHVPVNRVQSDNESFYFHEYLGGYEYENHIRSYNLDEDKMWHKLESITTRADYLYPESAHFIQLLRTNGYNPEILTFGEKRFQLAKIHPMIPFLVEDSKPDNIGITVVDKKKNQHIYDLHQGQRGVLIDDKPGQELPPGFTEIYINRLKVVNEPSLKGNIVMVSNLLQAVQVISRLNN